MSALPEPLESHRKRLERAGQLPEGAAVGAGENQACGDYAELGLGLREERIERAGFRARGCSATLALSAYVCAELEGRTLGEARAFDLHARVTAMGGLPPNRNHAVELVSRALDRALAQAARHCHPE